LICVDNRGERSPRIFRVRWQSDCATPLLANAKRVEKSIRAAVAKAPSSLRSAGAVHNRGGHNPRILECGGKRQRDTAFGQCQTREKSTRSAVAKAPSPLRSTGAVHNRGGNSPLILECGGKRLRDTAFGQCQTRGKIDTRSRA
jgi:hypothetical protein